MKRKIQFGSALRRGGARLFVGCLLGSGILLSTPAAHATDTAPGAGTNRILLFRTRTVSGGKTNQAFNLTINGSDIGSILVKNCDLNQDGTVSLAELKETASACFKLWDTNFVGSLTGAELAGELKQLFPQGGNRVAMRVINGVPVQVPPDQLPTPGVELAKHIMAAADSNQDGLLTIGELRAWLDNSFPGWDQDGNGSLDAAELNAAFGQLARPD